MQPEATGRSLNSEATKTMSINLVGNLSSCIVKINKQRFRSLVDTGAMCSLLDRKIYDRIKSLPKLSNKKVHLQSVNGSPLSVHGSIEILIEIGGVKVKQLLYVVPNMNRNIILGLDFLKNNDVRLYYDLGCLRIKNSYVPFEEDIQIASLVRLTSDQTIKPQTSCVCNAKIQNNPDLPPTLYQVSGVDKGYLSQEPGLMLANTVMKLHDQRTFPVMIVNTTNKTYHLHRGCVVGRAECIPSENVASDINEISKSDLLADVNVPSEHKSKVIKLIEKNSELFAQKDTDLGQTDTVKMTIDTGNHPPIKLRPYRAPLNNRKLIETAVHEMLEAKVIERSNFPWSFPCILVKKKDGSHRFCVDFRQLNKITKSNSNPLPVIDDILAQLGGSKYFTKKVLFYAGRD